MEMEIRMVVVDYGLWNFKHWLPRMLRAEGEARAGIVRAPASYEITYEIEDAYGEDDVETPVGATRIASASNALESWGAEGDYRVRRRRENGRTIRVLVPRDEDALATSPDLPPPIWDETRTTLSEDELDDLFGGLADLPMASLSGLPIGFTWGYQGRDLLRYNRVEGLSVGARLEWDRGGTAGRITGRIGLAHATPDLAIDVRRIRPDRRIVLSAYHSIASTDPRGRALEVGNSANALILGRDDGEYFRATGATLELLPPTTDRSWYRVRLYAERHEAVSARTDVALPGLWRADVFRPNIVADAADQVGASVRLSPWWGVDRNGAQGGLALFTQAATGDFEYARASATATLVFPVTSTVRAGFEVGGGTARGQVPVQREWFLGGGSTLRGYAGSTLRGPSFLRGRAELSRGIQAYGVAVFSDWAWAGTASSFEAKDGLYSAGVGFTSLDGLVRIDLARGLRTPVGWKLELYVDSLL